VAKRPESSAVGPIRDIRKFEEDRCLNRRQAGKLVPFLLARMHAQVRDEMLREPSVWVPLRDAYAFLFLLYTALRRFEFCRATCAEVDLAGAKLWVTGKNKLRDFVPLTDGALSLIAAWLDLKRRRGESTAAEAPLFATSEGGFLSFANLRLRWKRTLVAAGLPDKFGLHATRHTAGLLAYGQTGSIEKVARFLRHRSTATTARHYLHVDADELRRELSNIDLWRSP
jgi:integrase